MIVCNAVRRCVPRHGAADTQTQPGVLPALGTGSTKRSTPAGTQEEYIKEEQRNLKRELLRAQEEVKRIQVCSGQGDTMHESLTLLWAILWPWECFRFSLAGKSRAGDITRDDRN